MTGATNAVSRSDGAVIALRDIHKWFGSTHAVRGVSLDIYAGEVLGIVGTNGAGKSSLIKILGGVHEATSGTIEIHGETTLLDDPMAASRLGIQTVHQNIDDGVVPGLNVAENLTLDSLADGSLPLWTSARTVESRAKAIATGMNLDLDMQLPVEALGPSERQQLIIARALFRNPRLLILDEPTSTLSDVEVKVLFSTVRRLAAAGIAVIFVSHYLHQIEELCDRVAVLRDGRVEGVFERPLSRQVLVETMLGELVAVHRPPSDSHGGDLVLELDGIRAWPDGDPIHLEVRQGEVVGLTGLIGAGKTEVVEQVFGARPLVDGEMRLRGKPFRPSGPNEAVSAGIGMVPEERGKQAIIPAWPVSSNVTLPYLADYAGIAGIVSPGAERAATRAVAQRLSLVYGGPDAPIESLSGGNQQKVAVGRWLHADAELLILDEPFRGIDIGTRAEISAELRLIAVQRGVLVASSDPEEILEVADRVIVMAGGRVVGEVRSAEMSTALLAELMAGGGRS
jgi:simple sugar transport system ATP-binding protein